MTTPTPSTRPPSLLDKGEVARQAARFSTRYLTSGKLNGATPDPRRIAAAASRSKEISCNNNGITYPSIHQAARDLNLSASNISAMLNGRQKHTKGHTFCYTKIDTTTTTEGEAK